MPDKLKQIAPTGNVVVDPDRLRGLYSKYQISRLVDPKGKHNNCEYFVLDLNHDEFTIPMLQLYAKLSRDKFPRLSADLLAVIEKLKTRYR